MKRITWMFETIREAEAFAEGVEYVNEPAVTVFQLGSEVVVEDEDGEGDPEERDRTIGEMK